MASITEAVRPLRRAQALRTLGREEWPRWKPVALWLWETIPVLSFPAFSYGFWVLFETVLRVFDLSRGGEGVLGRILGTCLFPLGWPADLTVLFGFLMWRAAVYLAHDNAEFAGNEIVRRWLLARARAVFRHADFATAATTGESVFFVQVSGKIAGVRVRDAVAILWIQENDLSFVFWDGPPCVLPRGSFTGRTRRRWNLFGSFASWLALDDGTMYKLRLLCCDRATRISETQTDTTRLMRALEQWRNYIPVEWKGATRGAGPAVL